LKPASTLSPHRPSQHADAERPGFATAVALATLDIYRVAISPILTALLGNACRFHPNCSVYARQAVESHGLTRGAGLAMRRLWRCRPGGGWGDDPVPRPQREGVRS